MNISTNRTASTICWPIIKVCEWMGRNIPTTLIRIRFFAKFKRFPRLEKPIDLNEKILWMKLHADISQWIELADKYKVRGWLEKKGLSRYLVNLYGKWDNVEDIDFSKLPANLIFKVNNGDGKGTNKVVRDLPNADHVSLRKLFHKWLTRKNIGDLSAEPQYKHMSPCIIAEELLPVPQNVAVGGGKSLIDYKIWCINGIPKYIYTCCNRDDDGGGADVMTYDLDWNAHPEFSVFNHEYRRGKLLPKPQNLEEMIDLAKILCAEFPIVRVDLYNVDGRIYFGEMTFTSQGGMMDYFTQDFLNLLGKEADISGLKSVRNIIHK